MAIADPFAALGYGNGFPFCVPTEQPPDTLPFVGGFTLEEAMRLYWDLDYMTLSGVFSVTLDVSSTFEETRNYSFSVDLPRGGGNVGMADPHPDPVDSMIQPKDRNCELHSLGYWQFLPVVDYLGLRFRFSVGPRSFIPTPANYNTYRNGELYDLITRPDGSSGAWNMITLYVSRAINAAGTAPSRVACITNNPSDTWVSSPLSVDRGPVNLSFWGKTIPLRLYSRPEGQYPYPTSWSISQLTLTPHFWTYP